jgi:hypothetical protein
LIAAKVNVRVAPDKLWHRSRRQHRVAAVVDACSDSNPRAGIAIVGEKADDGRSHIEPNQADAQRQTVEERRFMAAVQDRRRQYFATFRVGYTPFQAVRKAHGTKFAWRVLDHAARSAVLQSQFPIGRVFGHLLHWRHLASTAAAVQRPRS